MQYSQLGFQVFKKGRCVLDEISCNLQCNYVKTHTQKFNNRGTHHANEIAPIPVENTTKHVNEHTQKTQIDIQNVVFFDVNNGQRRQKTHSNVDFEKCQNEQKKCQEGRKHMPE